MTIFQPHEVDKICENLKNKKIGVLPTDTIYGLHASASETFLHEKIHLLKKIKENTPLITLISDVSQLALFDVLVGEFEKSQISNLWPGPNTLIFKTNSGDTKSFRLPENEFLKNVINRTGPLVSTSANTHGDPNATNIKQAIGYFGDAVDFYVNSGELINPPSSVYKIFGGVVEKIR